ncbi:hypothetical protein ElyMa_006690700 [Elysia marginata]|uniref:Uncharacterized protein n=1 Tax=Elysia marginata TaxID=1093978 RepID=A0AAV4IQS8_9GAST|nr:hypothetical protein ElyMa_006690700 [Elysia marginata]
MAIARRRGSLRLGSSRSLCLYTDHFPRVTVRNQVDNRLEKDIPPTPLNSGLDARNYILICLPDKRRQKTCQACRGESYNALCGM